MSPQCCVATGLYEALGTVSAAVRAERTIAVATVIIILSILPREKDNRS